MRAQLHHQWYLISTVKEWLDSSKHRGERSSSCHFPADLYQASKTAGRACARARKLVREYEELMRLLVDEDALRTAYRENLDKHDFGFKGEPPDWLRKGLGAIRELEAFEPFRKLVIAPSPPQAVPSPKGSPVPRSVATEPPPRTAKQVADERVRSRRAALLKDYQAQLASHILKGYYPWYHSILKWAVDRGHVVQVLAKRRGFSLTTVEDRLGTIPEKIPLCCRRV